MKAARKRHILEEHYLDFYSRAVAIINDEDDAKDAVQEAVVKTLTRIGLRDEVGYCFRATENECINILRRHRRGIRRRRHTPRQENHAPQPLMSFRRIIACLLLTLTFVARGQRGLHARTTALFRGLPVGFCFQQRPISILVERDLPRE